MAKILSFSSRLQVKGSEALALLDLAQSPFVWGFIGFLLGRAAVFGEIWPFGLAYVAAWRGANSRRTTAIPILGVALGLTLVIGVRLAVPYYAALILLWMIKPRTAQEGNGLKHWLCCLAVSCLLVKMPLHYSLQPVAMVFVVGILECVLAMAAFHLLHFALERRLGEQLAFKEIFWLLLLSTLLVSLNWRIGGFSLRLFLIFYILVIGAKAGGVRVACVLGPVLALFSLLLGETPQFALFVVIGCLLLGTLNRFRWGAYVGASLALVFCANGSLGAETLQGFVTVLIAISIAQWTPAASLNQLARLVPGTSHFLDRQEGYGKHLKQVLDQRIDQYMTVFEELENTMVDVNDPLLYKQLEGMTELLQTMKEAFSPDVQFTRGFEEELLNRFSQEDLAYITVVKSPDGFDVFGARHQFCRGRCFCQQVADYCSGTLESRRYGVISCNCREAGECGFQIAPCPYYKLEIGQAKLAQQEISGDSQVTFEIDGGKVAILLSDGMGVGLRAHQESSVAVRLLERMIKAGYDLSTAVSLINRLLLLRNQDEMFVTIDLVVVDLFTGLLEFVKIGSAPSFIKRGRDVEVIHNHLLPVGVLTQVEVETDRRTLQEGEVLIMTTDGVLDAQRSIVRKDEWMCWNLRRLEDSTDMAAMAEQILDDSLGMANGQIQDDMMVVVARLIKSDSGIDTYRRAQFSG